MNHTFTISDEEYAYLTAYANMFGQTAEEYFDEWLNHFIESKKFEDSIFGEQGDQEVDEELLNDPLYRAGDGFPSEIAAHNSAAVNVE